MDEETAKLLIQRLDIQGKTLETAIARLEEASKFYQEKANELARAVDSTTVLIEALKHSLDESDTQIDDLAEITAKQMEMYQLAMGQAPQPTQPGQPGA